MITKYLIGSKKAKYLSNIIEEVFTSILEKKYGEEEIDNFSIIVNMDRGEIEIFQEKTIVEEIANIGTEILLKDVLKIDKSFL